jgi:hypothetical protein
MIPKNYMDNINFMYGPDWSIPKRGYKNSEEHMENARRFRKIYRNIESSEQVKELMRCNFDYKPDQDDR